MQIHSLKKALYSISNYLTYEKLSPSYKDFTIAISSSYEPKHYHQAVKYSHWKDAMQSVIRALEEKILGQTYL